MDYYRSTIESIKYVIYKLFGYAGIAGDFSVSDKSVYYEWTLLTLSDKDEKRLSNALKKKKFFGDEFDFKGISTVSNNVPVDDADPEDSFTTYAFSFVTPESKMPAALISNGVPTSDYINAPSLFDADFYGVDVKRAVNRALVFSSDSDYEYVNFDFVDSILEVSGWSAERGGVTTEVDIVGASSSSFSGNFGISNKDAIVLSKCIENGDENLLFLSLSDTNVIFRFMRSKKGYRHDMNGNLKFLDKCLIFKVVDSKPYDAFYDDNPQIGELSEQQRMMVGYGDRHPQGSQQISRPVLDDTIGLNFYPQDGNTRNRRSR